MRAVYPIALVAAIAVEFLVASVLAQAGSTPDRDLGLSKTSVFDAPAPEKTLWNTSEPGDLAPPTREAPELPPVIPHGVLDFLPITFDDNLCVECHQVEAKEPGEPTPIPKSHYEDLRRAPGTFGDTVVGARFNCMSCHLSPGDNAALVGNTYSM